MSLILLLIMYRKGIICENNFYFASYLWLGVITDVFMTGFKVLKRGAEFIKS